MLITKQSLTACTFSIIMVLLLPLNGQIAFAAPDEAKAIDDFTRAIKLHPQDCKAYMCRARIYETLKQEQDAINDYSSVIKLNPQNEEAYDKRGDIYYYVLKQVQKGLDDYNVYISLDPYNSKVYCSRGVAEKELGLNDKALKDFTTAIDLDPREWANFMYRSELYRKLGQTDKANEDSKRQDALLHCQKLEYCSAAIAGDPNNIGLYYLRAEKLTQAKQYAAALDDLTQVVRLTPNSAKAYYLRGKCWEELKSSQKAIEDYSTAIRLDPNGAQARRWDTNIFGDNHRGMVYKARGDAYIKQCRQDYSAFICNNIGTDEFHKRMVTAIQGMRFFGPGSAGYESACNLEAQVSKEIKDAEKAEAIYHMAIQDCSTAISLDNKDAGAYEKRAGTYKELHEYYNAIRDYGSAITLGGSSPIVVSFFTLYTERAYCYEQLQQYREAIVDYSTIIDPLGRVVSKQSAPDKDASANVREFTDNLNKLAIYILTEAYYDRGKAYNQLGQHKYAQADFNQACELDPKIVDRIAFDNKLKRANRTGKWSK